jgi:hypothetical protein
MNVPVSHRRVSHSPIPVLCLAQVLELNNGISTTKVLGRTENPLLAKNCMRAFNLKFLGA